MNAKEISERIKELNDSYVPRKKYIYYLYDVNDPDSTPRYVDVTKDTKEMMITEKENSKKNLLEKMIIPNCVWIQSIGEGNLRFKIIEELSIECSNDLAVSIMTKYIFDFRDKGYPLTNTFPYQGTGSDDWPQYTIREGVKGKYE